MRKALCTAVFLLAAIPGVAQSRVTPAPTPDHHERNPKDVFRLKPLPGGVYALYGRGGNVGFFVGPDAVVVVDSQFKDLAPAIVEQLPSVTAPPDKYPGTTHHHRAHTGRHDTQPRLPVIRRKRLPSRHF